VHEINMCGLLTLCSLARPPIHALQVQEAPKTQEVGAAAAVGGELKPSAVNAACQSSPESCSPDASLQGPQEEEAGPVVKTQPMDLTACVTDQQAEETGEVGCSCCCFRCADAVPKVVIQGWKTLLRFGSTEHMHRNSKWNYFLSCTFKCSVCGEVGGTL